MAGQHSMLLQQVMFTLWTPQTPFYQPHSIVALLHTTCCRPSCLQKSAEALTDMSATAEQTQGQSQNYQIPVRNPLWIPTAALLHHKSAAPSLALTNVCAVPGKHDALGCRSTHGIWDAQGTSTALSPVK